MTNDILDQAIDEVAREMTLGDPHRAAVFRRAVLARIERGEAAQRTRPGLWILVPMGAVAAIAIAIALLQPAPPADPARRIDPREQAGAVSPGPDTTPHASPRTDNRNIVGLNPGIRAVAATRVVVSREPDAMSAVPPADGVAPPAVLVVDPIAVEAIGIARLPMGEPIQVQRLEAITPIDVTPLGLDELPRRQE